MKKMMWTLALVLSVTLVGTAFAGPGCGGCKTKTTQANTEMGAKSGCSDQAATSSSCATAAKPGCPSSCSGHANATSADSKCSTECPVHAAGLPCPESCKTEHAGQECNPAECTYCTTFAAVLESGEVPTHECVDHANCTLCAASLAAIQVRNAPKTETGATTGSCAPGCTTPCGSKKANDARVKS